MAWAVPSLSKACKLTIPLKKETKEQQGVLLVPHLEGFPFIWWISLHKWRQINLHYCIKHIHKSNNYYSVIKTVSLAHTRNVQVLILEAVFSVPGPTDCSDLLPLWDFQRKWCNIRHRLNNYQGKKKICSIYYFSQIHLCNIADETMLFSYSPGKPWMIPWHCDVKEARIKLEFSSKTSRDLLEQVFRKISTSFWFQLLNLWSYF